MFTFNGCLGKNYLCYTKDFSVDQLTVSAVNFIPSQMKPIKCCERQTRIWTNDLATRGGQFVDFISSMNKGLHYSKFICILVFVSVIGVFTA